MENTMRGNARADRLKRLDDFYGLVYEDQSEFILRHINEPFIDLGCGHGLWLAKLFRLGIKNIGIDIDYESLLAGKKISSGLRCCADASKLPLRKGIFEAMIFREYAHHFDIDKILNEARRYNIRKLIFFEPNDTLLLRLTHLIIRHKDPYISIGDLINKLQNSSYSVEHLSFRDLFALSLSGGLIAPWSFPKLGLFGRLIVIIDRTICKLLPEILKRKFCIRFLLVAARDENIAFT